MNKKEIKTGGKTENLPANDSRRTLHVNLNFASSEAYKLLRTNILFSLPDEGKCRIIGVTSPLRGEGKSTTSINIAYSFAQTGKKVLLIDGDMRLPSVAKKMGYENEYGLSQILVSSGNASLKVTKSRELENWHILTSGEIPPNPSELIGSARMKTLLGALAQNYDFIIVDLPPVNIVSDALAVSPYLNGIVVVVCEDQSDKKSVSICVHRLEMAETKILGFVLNRAKEEEGGYRYRRNGKYYKKYKYSKYYDKYYYRKSETKPTDTPS